jgi:hypothetical protein
MMILPGELICRSSEPAQWIGVAADEINHFRGESMSRPQIRDPKIPDPAIPDPAHPLVDARPRIAYVVVRQEDVWFIKFDGADYGPYQSEREAMLFAVDAAHKLGEKGEETQVLLVDENGDPQAAWTFGQDPYPPKL